MNKRTLITAVIVIALCCAIGLAFASESFEKNKYPLQYNDLIETYAAKNGIDQSVLAAVIYCESSFDKDAESRVGAIGLMQLMPDTFDWLQRLMGDEFPGGEINNAETNIACGSYYLGWLLRKFGNIDTALAAYNAGHGNVANWLIDPNYSDDGITLKEIPLSETKNFVPKVNNVASIYKRLYFKEKQNDSSRS